MVAHADDGRLDLRRTPAAAIIAPFFALAGRTALLGALGLLAAAILPTLIASLAFRLL